MVCSARALIAFSSTALKCSLLQDSLQHFVTTQADNNYEPLEKKAFTIVTLWIVCDAHT